MPNWKGKKKGGRRRWIIRERVREREIEREREIHIYVYIYNIWRERLSERKIERDGRVKFRWRRSQQKIQKIVEHIDFIRSKNMRIAKQLHTYVPSDFCWIVHRIWYISPRLPQCLLSYRYSSSQGSFGLLSKFCFAGGILWRCWVGDLHYRQHPVSEIGSDRLTENIVGEKREGDKERGRQRERER